MCLNCCHESVSDIDFKSHTFNFLALARVLLHPVILFHFLKSSNFNLHPLGG
jgi:hypothetical protein